MLKPHKLIAGIIFAVIAIAIIAVVITMKADRATGEQSAGGSSTLSVITADGSSLGSSTQSSGVLSPQSGGLQPSVSNQTLQNTGEIK